MPPDVPLALTTPLLPSSPKNLQTFTAASEWPKFDAPTLPRRTYTSFPQAVQEGKDSRIYAGVHFRRAVDVGAAIGDAVGAFVWASSP